MLDVKIDTLLAVADCKNFTKAAAFLSLTQPAVSHHIKELEDECGAKLFIRGKGDFRLTEAGKIAVTYCRRFKALHEKMLQKIADSEKNISRFRIGITHTAENNTITEVLAHYVQDTHNISITLITDTIKNLYDMLENYEIDIAVVEGKRSLQNLNYCMLDTDCLVCVIGCDNPLAGQSMVTVGELKKQNMILRLPSSSTRKLFEATLISIDESIENFNVTLEVDNVATIKELVRKNLGISILPKSVCLRDAQKGKLKILPVENLSMMREMNLAYSKDFSHPEILKDMVRLYQEAMHPDMT